MTADLFLLGFLDIFARARQVAFQRAHPDFQRIHLAGHRFFFRGGVALAHFLVSGATALLRFLQRLFFGDEFLLPANAHGIELAFGLFLLFFERDDLRLQRGGFFLGAALEFRHALLMAAFQRGLLFLQLGRLRRIALPALPDIRLEGFGARRSTFLFRIGERSCAG